MNSKKRADIGLGAAIAYFTRQGWSVSVPLSESQRYDLIVDDAISHPKRVEVKTTDHMRSGDLYRVELRTSGGNKSGTGKITPFDPLCIDLLYVVSGDGSEYCIPAYDIKGGSSLHLGVRMQRWIVCTGKPSW
jgi:PD-(D/E)XK endonuclease